MGKRFAHGDKYDLAEVLSELMFDHTQLDVEGVDDQIVAIDTLGRKFIITIEES